MSRQLKSRWVTSTLVALALLAALPAATVAQPAHYSPTSLDRWISLWDQAWSWLAHGLRQGGGRLHGKDGASSDPDGQPTSHGGAVVGPTVLGTKEGLSSDPNGQPTSHGGRVARPQSLSTRDGASSDPNGGATTRAGTAADPDG
jgi:hypothetical protein